MKYLTKNKRLGDEHPDQSVWRNSTLSVKAFVIKKELEKASQ